MIRRSGSPRLIAGLLIASLPIASLPIAPAAGAPAGSSAFSALVTTTSGRFEGFLIETMGTIAWLGMPYATPPVGELRWSPPRDPHPEPGVRSARVYGNRCSQTAQPSSEDCLYLNVWRPNTRARNLPVFFYIHGGSNLDSSGEGSWYTVARHYNVVVVTINYRLGPMGWFLHPALLTGDAAQDSGNFGTLDQIQALAWVRENIGRFGGDQDNVTLVGASAGAQNVSYLMHSPRAKDLFQKALMESNFPGIRPVAAAYKSSKQVLYNLLVADGRAPTAVAAKEYAETRMTPADIRAYLRGKAAAEIRKAYYTAERGEINWGDLYRDDMPTAAHRGAATLVTAAVNRPEFVYAIGDGQVLPKNLSFADFSAGHVFPKPVIMGTTRNENNLWNAYWPFNFRGGTPLADLVTEAVEGSNPAYSGLQAFYQALSEGHADTFRKNYTFATNLIDELDAQLATRSTAQHLAAIRTRTPIPIYVYQFDWGSDPGKTYKIPNEDAWVFYVGAPHCAEADFFYQSFYGTLDGDDVAGYQYSAENLPGRRALSLAMRAYLWQFLHRQDGQIKPAPGQPVAWEPWTAAAPRYLVFGGDYREADVRMSHSATTRTPELLYAAHAAYPNAATRDFIEYYVLWSWHYNWYPNSSTGPFDTSPGRNPLFDPAKP